MSEPSLARQDEDAYWRSSKEFVRVLIAELNRVLRKQGVWKRKRRQICSEFAFEFAQFLDKLGGRWNISLFHYRNHGADFGRVLAGFEVSDADMPAFRAFLEELAYPYTPEYDNTAYRFFLG